MMGHTTKKYEFQLIVTEGNDEFWESLKDKTGCDEVHELIANALRQSGFIEGYDTTLKLIKFENN